MARITPATNAAIFTDDILDLLPTNKDLKRGVAMRLLSEDPEWRANNKLAMEKRSADPQWQINQKLRGEKLAQDPEWSVNHKLAMEKLGQDPVWLANNKLRGEKLAQDPEWRANNKLAAEKRAANPDWRASMKLVGEKRAELYKDPNNNSNYKGAAIGIHMETGEIIMLCGATEMRAAGFNSGCISQCILGKKKHHKKYIWSRDEPV